MNEAGSWEEALSATNTDRVMPEELRVALEGRDAETQLSPGHRTRLARPVRASQRVRLPERRPHDQVLQVFLSKDGRTGYERALTQVSFQDLVRCHPMRSFSRRNAQTNKPVAFFSRTVGDLLGCESQHERRFALLADWHPDVVHIAAQPFSMRFPTGSPVASHTPDFVLLSRSGAVVVVDVKWPSKAADVEAVRRHEQVRAELTRAGMQHVVWSGASRMLTENLANFAAARVPEQLWREVVPMLLAAHRPGIRVRELLETVEAGCGVPGLTSLVLVRRMLWEHQFTVDVSVPFALETVVGRS